jgi:MFS transporter, DHA3 family, macrolide efflux protein
MAKKVLSCNNKPFYLFLLSQGVTNLGDTFQFIAATSLLVRITGSGLFAAFGLICSPIISILFSAWAGYLSDSKHEKSLLVMIDLLRGIVAVLFIVRQNVITIYILIIILSTLDMFYNPPRKKLIANILESRHLIKGNSVLNGVSGSVYIIGPIMAGFLIGRYGENIAFFMNGVSFFISAFIISGMHYKSYKSINANKLKMKLKKTNQSAIEGVIYCMRTNSIRKVVFLGTVLCLASTSVNIAFYPYAFDVLKVSNTVWGSMMSVFYGAGVVSMFITLLAKNRIKQLLELSNPSLLIIISLIWMSYSITNNISCIIILQLVEGTAFSLLNTVLTTQLQASSRSDILGRVIGVNDFINSLGKILGIISTYLIISIKTPIIIFFTCALILFCYAIYVSLNTKIRQCS